MLKKATSFVKLIACSKKSNNKVFDAGTQQALPILIAS
jgi:hypothetical protein